MKRDLLLPYGIWAVFLLACMGPAGPAFAHHAMGGRTPATVMEGLISGLAHPVIGVDHFAFIIGVGFASSFLSARAAMALAFVVATLAGCALRLYGVALPLAEIVIAGSVILIGAIIMSGVWVPSLVYLVLFGIAGLFHGWSYGDSIIGAEQTPILAYLNGFAIIQFAVALSAMTVTRILWPSQRAVQLRLAGALIAGFGAAYLVENIEKILFPGIS